MEDMGAVEDMATGIVAEGTEADGITLFHQ
jgi:hypothetical protein